MTLKEKGLIALVVFSAGTAMLSENKSNFSPHKMTELIPDENSKLVQEMYSFGEGEYLLEGRQTPYMLQLAQTIFFDELAFTPDCQFNLENYLEIHHTNFLLYRFGFELADEQGVQDKYITQEEAFSYLKLVSRYKQKQCLKHHISNFI